MFGSLLITLLKHADRVTSASLAQLVNVIAPIMTEPGGPAWRQTTFFPFAATSPHAVARADLDVAVESRATTPSDSETVPLVDAVATHDEEAGQLAIFAVNRAVDHPTELVIDLATLGADAAALTASARTLSDPDLDAANTREDPERVALRDLPVHRNGSELRIPLPAVSWTEILLS